MSILDFLIKLNYTVFRKKIFRREVEAYFYSNKQFTLPKIPETLKDTGNYKKHFSLKIFTDNSGKEKIKKAVIALEKEEEIICAAENIIENKYVVFGNEINLGDEVKWNYDYIGFFEWPEKLVWKEDYFNFPKGVDIKVPWEIARFHQGITLAKAYLLSGDEKFVEHFIFLLKNFNKNNKFCVGVNWVCTTEIAIRLINIVYTFAILIESPLITSEIIALFLETVLYHSVFIENNLDYKKERDYGYLCSIFALALTGITLKETSYGKKNIKFAKSSFEQEIRNQINNDGISYEQSVLFHPFILRIFYLAKIGLNKIGEKFSAGFEERLKKMFEVQAAYLREDNSIPAVGDIPSSFAVKFNQNNNYSDTLAVGAFIYDDGNFKTRV